MHRLRLDQRLLWLACGLALLATAAEVLRVAQVRRHDAARRELAAGRPLAAAAAVAGLRLFPYDPATHYTRLVILKQLDRWRALSDEAAAMRRWHPQQAGLLRLQGEADWRLGRNQDAADALWDAFRFEPVPRDSPAQLWRIAMHAAADAAGAPSPRARAAARQVLALLDDDHRMTRQDRARARAEALRILAPEEAQGEGRDNP